MIRNRVVELKKKIAKDGGIIKIGLLLKTTDAERLGHLRARYQDKPYGPCDYINMMSSLPFSGRDTYERTLSDLASQQRPFTLKVGLPFKSLSSKLAAVGLDLPSREHMSLRQKLDVHLKRENIKPYALRRFTNPHPRFMVCSRLSEDAAVNLLGRLQRDYPNGAGIVTATVLVLIQYNHGLVIRDSHFFDLVNLPQTRPNMEFPFLGGKLAKPALSPPDRPKE